MVLYCSLIRYQKRCWSIWTAGQWSWKLKTAKECVTTHLPNGLALKMDGALAGDQCLSARASVLWAHRGAQQLMMKHLVWTCVEKLLLQILVVVANIQIGTLKTDVEHGSMWTSFGHGLGDPNPWGDLCMLALLYRLNGRGVNILQPGCGCLLVT